MKTISKNSKLFGLLSLLIFVSFIYLGCSGNSSDPDPDPDPEIEIETPERTVYKLNLRVHIMKDITMLHGSGVNMNSWVTPEDVTKTIIPEVNSIWEQADITWVLESIVEEDVVKTATYQESVNYVVNATRDSEGRSDPDRLPHLFSMMQPEHMSKTDEIGKNLFHIYLFPFIGNKSQGNAMIPYGGHTVLGTWTNKHNGGGTPEKRQLTENQNSFDRGSLSMTIAHEVGHILNLWHNQCGNSRCLMDSNGYSMTDAQVTASRLAAIDRI